MCSQRILYRVLAPVNWASAGGSQAGPYTTYCAIWQRCVFEILQSFIVPECFNVRHLALHYENKFEYIGGSI